MTESSRAQELTPGGPPPPSRDLTGSATVPHQPLLVMLKQTHDCLNPLDILNLAATFSGSSPQYLTIVANLRECRGSRIKEMILLHMGMITLNPVVADKAAETARSWETRLAS